MKVGSVRRVETSTTQDVLAGHVDYIVEHGNTRRNACDGAWLKDLVALNKNRRHGWEGVWLGDFVAHASISG